jgi:hypothetical protein
MKFVTITVDLDDGCAVLIHTEQVDPILYELSRLHLGAHTTKLAPRFRLRTAPERGRSSLEYGVVPSTLSRACYGAGAG